MVSLPSEAFMAIHYVVWFNSTLDKIATNGELEKPTRRFFILMASNSVLFMERYFLNTFKKLPFSNVKFCHTHKIHNVLGGEKKVFNEISSLRRSGLWYASMPFLFSSSLVTFINIIKLQYIYGCTTVQ